MRRYSDANWPRGAVYFTGGPVASFYECELVGTPGDPNYSVASAIRSGSVVIVTGDVVTVNGDTLVEVIVDDGVRYVFYHRAQAFFVSEVSQES